MTKLSSCMKVFALLFLAGAAVPLLAQKLTTLHSFENSDSYFPYAGVIQGTNGLFHRRAVVKHPLRPQQVRDGAVTTRR